MKIAIVANELQTKEFEFYFNDSNILVELYDDIPDYSKEFDAIFDFLYNNTDERNFKLQKLNTVTFINSVSYLLQNSNENFIRFNGWNSFIKRNIWEISISEKSNLRFKNILKALNINFIIIPNEIGFITPRIIAMIINEAYFALDENVSTKSEIDIAMKLGTNYPYGPFEWESIIGTQNIITLLQILSKKDERYKIAKELELKLQS